jgi:hypothetical protein
MANPTRRSDPVNDNGQPATTPPAARLPADLDAPDPYDVEALRLVGDFVPTKKTVLTIACRKPKPDEWVQARAGHNWRLLATVLELKGERGGTETYLVPAALRSALADEPLLRAKVLTAAITSHAVPFLWAANAPTDRENSWNQSMLIALEKAGRGWVRVVANAEAGAYEARDPQVRYAEPLWPDGLPTLTHWLRLAFPGDKLITDLGHPVLKQLRGDVP